MVPDLVFTILVIVQLPVLPVYIVVPPMKILETSYQHLIFILIVDIALRVGHSVVSNTL